jgi:predicted ATPase
VLRGLEIIDASIMGVSYIRNGTIPIVRLSGVERPVPLRGLGYGVARLFDILLALVNAEDGFLFIDEFENGLHYSIQEQAWKAVLDLAVELNVQVFATTHSSDCVEAFEQVSESAAEEMILTRLFVEDGTVRAETLGSSKLSRLLELGREVR